MSTEANQATVPSELWRWSAAALAAAIRERQVSSAEAVEAALGRIAAVNPALNALVHVSAGRAREAAAAADRAVVAGAELGPLHGVPIAIKDNVDEEGLANTGGIPAAAGTIAADDAPVVANLRSAGAISVGRSNVPAFSLRWFSDNELHGRTLNPWDATKTPGGSSGGAAAAVASGMVPLAHGNDIGGSVRYPAHVCGVMGLRPTVGRIPSWTGPTDAVPGLPPSPLLMAVEGMLARTAADLDLGLRAMAQPDLRDPACGPAPFAREAPLPRGTTLALFRGSPAGAPADDRQQAALNQAAARLRDAGFIVEEIDVPQLAEAHRLWLLLLYEDLRGLVGQVRAVGGEAINRSLDLGYEIQAETWGSPDLEMYIAGHVRRSALIAEMQALLETYRVLLMPAAGAIAPDHDADLDPGTAGTLMATQWPNTSVPALGLPALSLPTGVIDGLPAGVQLLGGRFRESWLLDVAEAVETHMPRLTPIDPAWDAS